MKWMEPMSIWFKVLFSSAILFFSKISCKEPLNESFIGGQLVNAAIALIVIETCFMDDDSSNAMLREHY